MEFKQFGTNLDRFKYIIEDDGIRIIRRRIASSTETFVEFEDVGSKIIKEKSRKLLWLIISFLFLVFAIAVFYKRLNGGKVGYGAEAFHLCVSAFFFIVYLLLKKSTLFLVQADNTNAIEFIGTKRYERRVEEFINQLLQARDNYLINKYSTIDEFLPYSQQYNNLVWLYNLKLLTKEQLQFKIAALDNLDTAKDSSNKSTLTKIIGFRKGRLTDEEEEDDENES